MTPRDPGGADHERAEMLPNTRLANIAHACLLYTCVLSARRAIPDVRPPASVSTDAPPRRRQAHRRPQMAIEPRTVQIAEICSEFAGH